ncbi:MAG: prepilin-type N-terminal cleavage/methylation domain-containing protein [Solirubrobacteraceae bacterium]|nr:prepilin-type N-terminal cleavage/methylation domain-containing protein [Solirubrobacteraceae bacterium]
MGEKRGVESRAALCASVERRFAPQWEKPHSTSHLPLTSKGFTLVEMIMVIVITGIIGGIVAMFLKAPIRQYTDVARRADMTDIADTALRRIGRDLRLALPNSVRVTGPCNGTAACFIEFLPTKGGGRYRVGAGGTNDELDFSVADSTFEVLGPMPTGLVAGTDQIVVYNLGISGADTYAGDNRATVSAPPAGAVANITSKLFPFDSPGHRFHVISAPVSYVCSPVAGGTGGTLTRYWGYAIQATQPSNTAVAPLSTASNALLATHVSSCRFSYDAFVVAQRSGLVTTNLGITEEGETVTLYSAVHVSNQP